MSTGNDGGGAGTGTGSGGAGTGPPLRDRIAVFFLIAGAEIFKLIPRGAISRNSP